MAEYKASSTKRSDRTTVRLGDMHNAALAAINAKEEKNLSVLVRRALRAYLRPDRRQFDTRPLIQSLDQLRSDLARTGSNLNQLAHGFNMHGPAGFRRDALAVIHDDLRTEFAKVMTKLHEIEHELRR